VKLVLVLEIVLFAAAFAVLHRALARRVAEAARWEARCHMRRPFSRASFDQPGSP